MAVWEEPLRYIRRFILTDEELEAAGEPPSPTADHVELTEPAPQLEAIESKEPHTLPRRAADWA
jgi:hypothetical protein